MHIPNLRPTLIIVFDTETTGIPEWKEPSGSEVQPHIVQLAALLVNADTQRIIQSMDVIVKPNGWVIPKETIDVHGITNEHAMDVGIPEDLVLDMFLEMWSSRVRVAHNTTFDNRIIRIATKRYSEKAIVEAWKDGPYECTGLLSKPIMKMEPKGKFGYKMPKLEEAYRHFMGKELENSHTAIADARACMDIFFAIKTGRGHDLAEQAFRPNINN